MNINNDEEAISFFNRLLDSLHQAGYGFNGSIQLVYVAKGAQHVGNIQTQHVYNDKRQESTPPPPDSPPTLPESLSTPEAMVLWEKAQRAGYVDANYQPKISRSQAALLADAMAERLGIKNKWKVFEGLWNRKNMYRDYYKALNLVQSLAFQDEIKRLFR